MDSCRRRGGVQSGVVQQPRRARVHLARPPNHRVRRLHLGSWYSAAPAALPRQRFASCALAGRERPEACAQCDSGGRVLYHMQSMKQHDHEVSAFHGDIAPLAAGTCRQRRGRTTFVARRRCRTSRRMSSPATGGSPCCPSGLFGNSRSVRLGSHANSTLSEIGACQLGQVAPANSLFGNRHHCSLHGDVGMDNSTEYSVPLQCI